MWKIRGKTFLQQCWKKYLFPVVLVVIQCVMLEQSSASLGQITGQTYELHTADYIVEFFVGMRPYIPGGSSWFNIPGIWSLYYVYFFILIGRTFRSLSAKYEQQMILRCVTRSAWWREQNFELVLETAGYHIASVLIFLAYGLCRGAKMTGINELLWQEYKGIGLSGFTALKVIGSTVVISFFIMLALAYLQYVISLRGNAVIGVILNTAILTASVYYQHPLLPGNYTMLLRQKQITGSGVELWQGVLLSAGMILILTWTAKRLMKKKDLF